METTAVTTNLRNELVKRLNDAYQFISESQRVQGISEQELIRVKSKGIAVLASIEIVLSEIVTDDVEQYLATKQTISSLHQFFCDHDINDFASGSRSGYALAVRYMDFVLRITQRDSV